MNQLGKSEPTHGPGHVDIGEQHNDLCVAFEKLHGFGYIGRLDYPRPTFLKNIARYLVSCADVVLLGIAAYSGAVVVF